LLLTSGTRDMIMPQSWLNTIFKHSIEEIQIQVAAFWSIS